MTREEFTAAVRGRLIVSCQAGEGHPLRDSATISRLAVAAVAGGAAAIRAGGAGGTADIAAVRAAVCVPLIGLTKNGAAGVYITPTVAAAITVCRAGADVVAVDGTSRPRPDGRPLADTVRAVHAAGGLVMADITRPDDAAAALAAGADIIATTLAGYVPGPPPPGPDLALVTAVRAALPRGAVVIAEGRYHHPDQAAAAVSSGADAVVVGTAITDPVWLTQRFASAVEGARA